MILAAVAYVVIGILFSVLSRSAGGERRRGRGAHRVRTLSTEQFASCDGAPCGRGGGPGGLRPCARRKRALGARRNTRPTAASPRTARVARHHGHSSVSWGTRRGGRADSLFAASRQMNAREGR